MAAQGRQFWSARGIRLMDWLLAVYLVVWLVVGVLIGVDIRRQADLSDQVTRVGAALTDVGDSLEVVGGLPLVGGNIDRLAERVHDAGDDVQRSGRDSRQSLERMGIMVGAAFVAVPLMLVLPVYLPLRFAWRREVRAVARALRGLDSTALDQLLARRALATLPYEQVLAMDRAPLGELTHEEARRLADAELTRLGLERS